MGIFNEHNLAQPLPSNCRYGIRVKLRGSDPFRNLVAGGWHKEHWFETATERDVALKEMSERYVYFRPGDKPTLDFEKIEKK
jgi:hypothetical protein